MLGDLLDQLLGHVLRVELDKEVQMQWLLTRLQEIWLVQHLITTPDYNTFDTSLKKTVNLFVQLHPGQVALVVLVLETKVPRLPQEGVNILKNKVCNDKG